MTDEANAAWTASDAQIRKVAVDAGMDFKGTADQMAGFEFPSAADQLASYFNKDGLAASGAESVGLTFKKPGAWNVDQKIKRVITGEFLE